MKKAREDGKKIVYIGFGSIVVPNPRVMTRNIIKAVVRSGVRAIVSKGWSARMVEGSSGKKAEAEEEEIEFPEECFSVDKIPHDWLFPQIDAALHHGGAGTTGASLRGGFYLLPFFTHPRSRAHVRSVDIAGIPTLIRPWFGDQFFWASRVHKLGAGLKVSSLRVGELSDALIKATTDRVMKEKAARVGERIREVRYTSFTLLRGGYSRLTMTTSRRTGYRTRYMPFIRICREQRGIGSPSINDPFFFFILSVFTFSLNLLIHSATTNS